MDVSDRGHIKRTHAEYRRVAGMRMIPKTLMEKHLYPSSVLLPQGEIKKTVLLYVSLQDTAIFSVAGY